MRRNKSILIAAAVALAAAGIAAWALPGERAAGDRLGLFSSLPIYWNESASMAEALDGNGEAHWVRTALEEDYTLVPLDTLDGDELDKLGRLIIAQPRPLSPAENVALDRWVRRGGRLMLFADPFLTDHSRFGLGDKRRPQDTVLLSPILRRWGLELAFDESQPDREREVRFGGERVPVHLAGSLAAVEPSAAVKCELAAEDVTAVCIVGRGRVIVLADAAVLEAERGAGAGAEPLAELLDRAFAD